MSTVEIVREICKQKGIKVSKMEKDLGFGNGYLNPKKIKNIDSDRLGVIAQYLGVSVSVLLGAEPADDMNEYLQQIKDNPGQRLLFDKTKNATPEQLQAIVSMIDAFMQK